MKNSGLDVLDLQFTGLPLDVLAEDTGTRRSRVARKIDRGLVKARPTLFGYQFLLRLRPHHAGSEFHHQDAQETGATR